MKKNKGSIYTVYILKLVLFAIGLIGLLFCLYLIINKDSGQTPYWKKVKEIPQINLFKFFGLKWNLILLVVLCLAGALYKWPVFELLARRQERRRFVEFCQGVHMAMVSADVGRGKTLLLSILAREMPHGIKKIGFVSNVPDAQLVSYNDINFDLPIPKNESYRIPKYFFLDEMNFIIEGTSVYENRLYHKGVAWFLQILRHHRVRAWMSATRDNHVWVSVRQMANYYVKLGGLKPLMDISGYVFYTQRIRFYSQDWELQEEFNIEINNLDFELYDSYWLKDTSYFRPTLEGIAEEGKKKRARKLEEMKKKKTVEQRKKTKKYFPLTYEPDYERKFKEKLKDLVKVLETVKLKLNTKKTEIPKVEKVEKITKETVKPKKIGKKKRISPLKDFINNFK